MNNLFWDSSAIIKILHSENDTPFFASLHGDKSNRHFASAISRVEVSGAFRRKYNEYSGKREQDKIKTLYQREPGIIDFQQALLKSWKHKLLKSFIILQIDLDVINEAESLVSRFNIRSLDAVVLATSLILNSQGQNVSFVSADKQQIRVAQSVGIKLIVPGGNY